VLWIEEMSSVVSRWGRALLVDQGDQADDEGDNNNNEDDDDDEEDGRAADASIRWNCIKL
jgi:hypothetical protein